VVECLFSKHKALSSNTRTTPPPKKKAENRLGTVAHAYIQEAKTGGLFEPRSHSKTLSQKKKKIIGCSSSSVVEHFNHSY
jgi:hypothetical protein